MALTVRLPTALYERVRALAELRDTSLNSLLTDALNTAVSQQEQAMLFAAFSEVGADGDLTSVEFATSAQREVLDESNVSRT